MKDFFRQLVIQIRDFFAKITSSSKKVKIIVALVALLLVAVIVAVCLVVNERNKEYYDSTAVATNYSASVLDNDYATAFTRSILAYKGEKNMYKLYMSDIESSKLTDENKETASAIADAMLDDVQSYVALNGMTDYNAFCSWFFTEASKLIPAYVGDDQLTRQVLVETLNQTLALYKDYMLEENTSAYQDDGGYNPQMTLSEEYDFTSDEVALYKEKKTDDQLQALSDLKVDVNKINAVKRFTFSVTINDNEIKQIKFYLIQIGSKWFVDTTALIY